MPATYDVLDTARSAKRIVYVNNRMINLDVTYFCDPSSDSDVLLRMTVQIQFKFLRQKSGI